MECRRKVASGRRFTCVIKSLVNTRGSQLNYAKVRIVQVDNLRGSLGIRRIDKVPNARIRELCGVTEGLNERIDDGVLWWFGHVERMENDRITKQLLLCCDWLCIVYFN